MRDNDGYTSYKCPSQVRIKPKSYKTHLCLPKIFLLGYPKCGSTFLYCLLHIVLKFSGHMANSYDAIKEPHWWVIPGPRNNTQSRSPDYLALYLLNFAKGAEYVKTSLPAVTIDASPNLMFQWPRYTEAETMKNYCLIPSLVPVLLPDSKYIVVMRNPVSMLYSAFWFSCTRTHQHFQSVKYMGPDIFHKRITRKIEIFNLCKSAGEPLDKCMDAVANNIYGPDLFDLPGHKFRDIIQCGNHQQKTIDYKHNPRLVMRNDTRQILIEFFKPYNQMLANLPGDDKFLWNDD